MLLDPKLVNKNATYMFDSCVVNNAEEYFKGQCAWEDVGVKLVNNNELQITLKYPATELDFYTTILLIYTGGTIGMIENPETGALENFNFDHLQPDLAGPGRNV